MGLRTIEELSLNDRMPKIKLLSHFNKSIID